MGRICPILNHPLKDGVLVDDNAIVNFIQKRNVDFLPNELVCRSCKHELVKLYNKKLKKARELYKSHLRDSSVSSVTTSKTTSTTSSVYGGSEPIAEIGQGTQRPDAAASKTIQVLQKQTNVGQSENEGNKNTSTTTKVISVSETAIVLSTSISNTHSILQENGDNQTVNKNSAQAQQPYVTLRKRTLRDFFTEKPREPNVILITPPSTITAQSSTNANLAKQIKHTTTSNASEARRLSQEPTTSRAANLPKRARILRVGSDDEDDVHVSLNAVNGTRLPHIQPIPPKRKPEQQKSLARDIMDDYIKDITGG